MLLLKKKEHLLLKKLPIQNGKEFKTSLVSNEAGLYTSFIDNGKNRETLSPVYNNAPKVTETPSNKNLQTLFELTGDEAVVSYLEKGYTKYYKFTLTLDRSITYISKRRKAKIKKTY